MSARHPDPAVREEMQRIAEERAARTSYLMDYGPDWPPAPEKARPKPTSMKLWHKCVAAIGTYGVLYVTAALVLQFLVPTGKTLDFPSGEGQGHSADVTTTLPPHPEVGRR